MARGRFNSCSLALLSLPFLVALILPTPLSTANAGDLTTAQQRFRKAQSSLEQAIAAEEAAFRERDDFLRGHFDLLSSKLTAPTTPETAQREEPKVNPAWQSLNEQVRILERERDALLERLTPEHPLAAALNDKLAAAIAARDAEPQLLVPEPSSAPALPAASTGSATLAAADLAVERFQELEAKCKQAAAEVDRLDAEQHEAHRALAALQAAEQRSITGPSTSDSSSSQVLIWGVVMLVAAGGVFAFARFQAKRTATLSPKEVAGALAVPLLGVIETRPQSIAA